MKYKHKPTIVDAVQWFPGDSHPRIDEEDIIDFERICSDCGNPGPHGFVVDDDFDWLPICPGGWIITYESGAIDTLTDSQFNETYEAVL